MPVEGEGPAEYLPEDPRHDLPREILKEIALDPSEARRSMLRPDIFVYLEAEEYGQIQRVQMDVAQRLPNGYLVHRRIEGLGGKFKQSRRIEITNGATVYEERETTPAVEDVRWFLDTLRDVRQTQTLAEIFLQTEEGKAYVKEHTEAEPLLSSTAESIIAEAKGFATEHGSNARLRYGDIEVDVSSEEIIVARDEWVRTSQNELVKYTFESVVAMTPPHKLLADEYFTIVDYGPQQALFERLKEFAEAEGVTSRPQQPTELEGQALLYYLRNGEVVPPPSVV